MKETFDKSNWKRKFGVFKTSCFQTHNVSTLLFVLRIIKMVIMAIIRVFFIHCELKDLQT